MYAEIFTKGLSISKNYKKRPIEDTHELYRIINKAAFVAQDKTHRESEKAMQFLIDIYTPFISSVSFNLYKKISGTLELSDVKQEVCCNFIFLVDKYNHDKSEFSYYIQKMLPRYMIKWVNKELTYNSRMSPFSSNVNLIYDSVLNSDEAVENFLMSFIIHNEYITYMNASSLEKSKSRTNEEICLNYFLGSDTISEIAGRLNISYHAVYQKISSKKENLKDFFRTNPYCGLNITSTGIDVIDGRTN